MRANQEKLIQNSIERYLSLKNIFFWKNNSGALKVDSRFIRFGAVGSPDICAVHNGRFIGFEVKTSSGRQSEHQKAFEQALREAGGEYYLVRSIEDVQALGF